MFGDRQAGQNNSGYDYSLEKMALDKNDVGAPDYDPLFNRQSYV